MLQQALDALQPEHPYLNPEAIDALADLNDPRATEALIEAATNGPFRLNGVEALGRHAALLEFAEETSMKALQRFAEDRKSAIRQLAQQILASVGHFD